MRSVCPAGLLNSPVARKAVQEWKEANVEEEKRDAHSERKRRAQEEGMGGGGPSEPVTRGASGVSGTIH